MAAESISLRLGLARWPGQLTALGGLWGAAPSQEEGRVPLRSRGCMAPPALRALLQPMGKGRRWSPGPSPGELETRSEAAVPRKACRLVGRWRRTSSGSRSLTAVGAGALPGGQVPGREAGRCLAAGCTVRGPWKFCGLRTRELLADVRRPLARPLGAARKGGGREALWGKGSEPPSPRPPGRFLVCSSHPSVTSTARASSRAPCVRTCAACAGSSGGPASPPPAASR